MPRLDVEHLGLYLLLLSLPLNHTQTSEAILFWLHQSEVIKRTVFLKVRKGRKISGSEWEQDVFLGVCVSLVCLCVRCPLWMAANRQSDKLEVAASWRGNWLTRSQTKRVHPHEPHQSTPCLLYLSAFCSDTFVTQKMSEFSSAVLLFQHEVCVGY